MNARSGANDAGAAVIASARHARRAGIAVAPAAGDRRLGSRRRARIALASSAGNSIAGPRAWSAHTRRARVHTSVPGRSGSAEVRTVTSMAAARASSAPATDPRHDAGEWFAIQVWTGRESATADHLRSRGYAVFVPRHVERRRWSDRLKCVERPTFPGYAFCRTTPEASGKIVEKVDSTFLTLTDFSPQLR